MSTDSDNPYGESPTIRSEKDLRNALNKADVCTCANCDSVMPTGCQGTFKDESSCALNGGPTYLGHHIEIEEPDSCNERAAVDKILAKLGIENGRTECGNLKLQVILNHIQETLDALAASHSASVDFANKYIASVSPHPAQPQPSSEQEKTHD